MIKKLLLLNGGCVIIKGLPIFSSAAAATAGVDGVSMPIQSNTVAYTIVGLPNSAPHAIGESIGTGATHINVLDLGTARTLKNFNYIGGIVGSWDARISKLEASVNNSNWTTIFSGYTNSIDQAITDTTKYRYIRYTLVAASGATGTSYAGAFNVTYEQIF